MGEDEDDALAMSVYNESLAVAIRRGAPLVSYSIDRRCIFEYNTHAMNVDTAVVICLLCARKFPRVYGTKRRLIDYQRVLTDAVNDKREFFLDTVDRRTTKRLFGVHEYCRKYGEMNDKVTLTENDADFDDWHLWLPFATGAVKILCCPEDIQCPVRDSGTGHARNESCKECRAPVCSECRKDLCNQRFRVQL